MSRLENFKIFNFNEGVPYVSVTSNGITFNKAVVMKLGYPEHVLLLTDEESCCIAVQKSDADNPRAAAFYKPKKSKVISVRWNGRDLLNTICEMTGWDLSMHSYRIDGALLREENAMLFNLREAKELKSVVDG